MRTAALVLLLALAGCATVQLPPVGPPETQAQTPAERIGDKVFEADWNSPLGAALKCGGPGYGNPFGCDLPPDAKWGVLPQEGGGGVECAKPTPNLCFKLADGVLYFHSGDPGMALISSQTFDGSRPHSLEAVVYVRNDCSGVSFMGIVDYGGGPDDGDHTGGTYAATYVSCGGPGDAPKLWLYRPSLAIPITGPITQGLHVLRQDYMPDEGFEVFLDNVMVKPFGENEIDPLRFPAGHDPHFALWFGCVDGFVSRFDGYMAPLSAP